MFDSRAIDEGRAKAWVSSVLGNWQREPETANCRSEVAVPIASEQVSNAKVVEKEQYVTIKPSTGRHLV